MLLKSHSLIDCYLIINLLHYIKVITLEEKIMAYALVQKDKYVFHLTKIKHISSILKHGILCKNNVLEKKLKIDDVSNPNIQDRRSKILIPNTEYTLHDCTPMFFGARPPMLHAISYRGILQEDMVYAIIYWRILENPNVWFTDGNASMPETDFYSNPSDLKHIDFKAASAIWWNDKELRRKKQAEVLKLNRVDIDEIHGFVVYNEQAEKKIIKMLSSQNIEKAVFIAKEFYYEY